jgi:drug/metabolite transporter (DMT)-like permease
VSWKDLICLLLIVVGIVLFLYGSNYYDTTIGWAGVAVAIVGLVAELALSIFGSLRKKGKDLEAVEP